MSLLSRLFGGGPTAPAPKPVEHEGCRIYAEPMPDGGKFRLAARIEKDVDGEARIHQLIRADMLDSHDAAAQAAVAKARQVIDEQGDTLFKPR